MTANMIVYVVIAEAVYDHGVLCVSSTREAAEREAAAAWRKSDGHHRFRVEERLVDGEPLVQFDLTLYIVEPKTTNEPEIEFVPLGANWTRWNWRSPT